MIDLRSGKNEAPKVSIIIPTYNYGCFISNAIESALNQEYDNIEVIVVDDGSTDNTQEILRRYEQKITHCYQENCGSAVAMNRGVELSSGTYLLFLGADDVLLPCTISLLRERLMEYPECGVFFGDARLKDLRSGQEYPSLLNRRGDFSRVPKEELEPNVYVLCAKFYKFIISGSFIPCCSAMILREYFEEIGGFDPYLRMAQDRDLWIRLSGRCRFGFANRPISVVTMHGGNLTCDMSADRLLYSVHILHKVLNSNLVDDAPDFRTYVKQRIPTILYQAAWLDITLGREGRGRKSAVRLLRMRGFSMKALIVLAASLVPKKIRKACWDAIKKYAGKLSPWEKEKPERP